MVNAARQTNDTLLTHIHTHTHPLSYTNKNSRTHTRAKVRRQRHIKVRVGTPVETLSLSNTIAHTHFYLTSKEKSPPNITTAANRTKK